ncbi:aminotransferase class V-fold PLP-dependent enzyme [Proteus mirabilis]|uniref:aminotransferase class V-fold PLP-dependent enzyme n=1 Tax=Proteus mirabilis TaxID=584 RepID=UPI0039C655E8
MPQDYLQQGIDLVTFSGDKLLGGPQAGIILGKKAWIEAIQHHPLKRALRVDKMTLAALDATLRLYQQPEKMIKDIPTLRLLTRTQTEIHDMAQRLLPHFQAYYGDNYHITISSCASQIGSGSLPIESLPSAAKLVIEPLPKSMAVGKFISLPSAASCAPSTSAVKP